MKLTEIIELTEAKVVTGNINESPDFQKAFSSDLMSDVLTLDEHNIILITGLANVQLVRTAEMADIEVVLLARNKIASKEMLELANENGLIILQTPYSIFRVSGVLYNNGLHPVY